MTDWLLDPDIAYLNHGGFGALPRVVGNAAADLRAMMERDPSDLLMRRLPGLVDEVRGQLAEFLGADPAGCVFVPNATSGMSAVLSSLAPSFDAGDEILTTDHRYHALSVQLDVLSARYGVTPVYAHVPVTATDVASIVAAVTKRITPRTRLLVIDAIASASGFVFPVAELVAAAHDRGVPVMVDAAHAPGQIANNVNAIGAEFWVGNLHKWICSPRAAAVLCVTPQWRETVRPQVASHHYAEGFQPAFDWTGTFDPVTILAVPTALEFWQRLGWDEVRRTQRQLVDDGARRVAAVLETAAPVADDFRAAMRIVELPAQLDEPQARDIERTLADKHRVEVSLTQLHDRVWLRVCGQIYNSSADYERLAAALPELLSGAT